MSTSTLADFAARVRSMTGLPLAFIPDATEEELLGGSIVTTSPWGTVVLKDPLPEYREDGEQTYTRAVLVGRKAPCPRALPQADGLIPTWDREGFDAPGREAAEAAFATYCFGSSFDEPNQEFIAAGYWPGDADDIWSQERWARAAVSRRSLFGFRVAR